MGTQAGAIVLDTDLATIRAASDLKPVCRVYATGVQSLADNTLTIINFGGEDIDTHGYHSTSVNTNRISPTVAGVYRLTFTFFLTGATTYTAIRGQIRKNATVIAPVIQWGNYVNAVTQAFSISLLASADGVADYFDTQILQDNTANVAVNTVAASPNIAVFEAEFIRSPA